MFATVQDSDKALREGLLSVLDETDWYKAVYSRLWTHRTAIIMKDDELCHVRKFEVGGSRGCGGWWELVVDDGKQRKKVEEGGGRQWTIRDDGEYWWTTDESWVWWSMVGNDMMLSVLVLSSLLVGQV